MCEFCENIEKIKYTDDGTYENHFPRVNIPQIIQYEENGSYNLWCDGGGDSVFAGVEFKNIKFCPYCGRRLGE